MTVFLKRSWKEATFVKKSLKISWKKLQISPKDLKKKPTHFIKWTWKEKKSYIRVWIFLFQKLIFLPFFFLFLLLQICLSECNSWKYPFFNESILFFSKIVFFNKSVLPFFLKNGKNRDTLVTFYIQISIILQFVSHLADLLLFLINVLIFIYLFISKWTS